MASKFSANYLPELFALGLFRHRPAMVTVNLTALCNQHCIYCEIGQDAASGRAESLSIEDLKWVIDQMAISKIPKISLCGGEPFLFGGLVEVVEYAWTRNIRCSVTSNGMTVHHLNENQLEALKTCNTEVNISIDSFRDEIQSLTRGTSTALDNALKSVRKLSGYGIPVTVLTVISRYNVHELSGFVASAYEKGIRQVLFQPVIYYSNYPDRPAVDAKSNLNAGVDQLGVLMNELAAILEFERRHNIKTNVYRIIPWIGLYLETAAGQNGKWFFGELLPEFYCREIHAIIDISYDGGIQPCGLRPAKGSIMNDRQAGLMALWSSATQEIKKDMSEHRYYDCCNGCCHHFSRNMLASVAKYPWKNRKALFILVPLVISRVMKRISFRNMTAKIK